MPDPVLLEGIAPIQDRFDGWIIDQWGVLHDGNALLPEALDALWRLRTDGKRVVLLSNTGRRLAHNLEQLRRMGLCDDLVAGVVTSGETAWQMLAAGVEPFATFGRRCLLWSEGHDRAILDGLDLEPVEGPADADFILLAGIPHGCDLDDLRPDLAEAAARRLPMICCNPDRVVVGPAGMVPATGAIAALYEAAGGIVRYVGKPYAPVYRACLKLLEAIPEQRIIAVGDSLEHDVGGGASAGLSTALVLAGIHRSELGEDPCDPRFEREFRRLVASHGASPTFVLPRFVWTSEQRRQR